MKICAISDLHGALLDNIEPCELVLICGDIIPLYIQNDIPKSREWFKTRFSEWVNSLPCEQVIFIAGNHDFYLSQAISEDIYTNIAIPTINKAIYLENNYIDYLSKEGKIYRIFGTPDCQIFGNWVFMYSDEKLKEVYQNIPGNCDILISHDAPRLNNCGLVPNNEWFPFPIEAGNEVLASVIIDKKPKYAFCGHIHEGNHQLTDIGTTKIANVSILNNAYDIAYLPLYLDI